MLKFYRLFGFSCKMNLKNLIELELSKICFAFWCLHKGGYKINCLSLWSIFYSKVHQQFERQSYFFMKTQIFSFGILRFLICYLYYFLKILKIISNPRSINNVLFWNWCRCHTIDGSGSKSAFFKQLLTILKSC